MVLIRTAIQRVMVKWKGYVKRNQQEDKMKDGMCVVKTTDQMIADGGENDGGEIIIGKYRWLDIMEANCPVHRHIELKDNEWTDANGYTWSISPEMLLGPAIKPGTRVEVSDNGEDWKPAFFRGYVFETCDRRVYTQHGFSGFYRYVRLTEKPKEDQCPTCGSPSKSVKCRVKSWFDSTCVNSWHDKKPKTRPRTALETMEWFRDNPEFVWRYIKDAESDKPLVYVGATWYTAWPTDIEVARLKDGKLGEWGPVPEIEDESK